MTNIISDMNGLEFVDTHCHVDLYQNPILVIDQLERMKVHTIAVTNTPSAFFKTQVLCKKSKFVHAAVGFHPELVPSHEHEVEKISALIDQTRYIGEIGLDYVTEDEMLRKRQRKIFELILLLCAQDKNKILTIHSRRSTSDVLAMIGNDFPGTVILHWFSGTKKELKTAIDMGCWFSVNPLMTLSKSGQSLIRAIPRERILTETDGPFVKLNGRTIASTDLIKAISQIASIWSQDIEEVAQKLIQNFVSLLR